MKVFVRAICIPAGLQISRQCSLVAARATSDWGMGFMFGIGSILRALVFTQLGLCVVCEEHVAGSGFGGAVTKGGADPHDVLKNNLRIGS